MEKLHFVWMGFGLIVGLLVVLIAVLLITQWIWDHRAKPVILETLRDGEEYRGYALQKVLRGKGINIPIACFYVLMSKLEDQNLVSRRYDPIPSNPDRMTGENYYRLKET